MSTSRPKPDINGAKDAYEAFDNLIEACPEYQWQKDAGWVPVLMKCHWQLRREAMDWVKTQGDRFNPQEPEDQDPTLWGTPNGVWNAPGGQLIIFRHKKTAIQFKLIYG